MNKSSVSAFRFGAHIAIQTQSSLIFLDPEFALNLAKDLNTVASSMSSNSKTNIIRIK